MSVLLAAWLPQRSLALPLSIDYQTADLGAGHWSYTYQVINDSLPDPIREFTIWFDQSRYRNLQVITPDPPAGSWNEIVVQPDPILHDDGFYDALSLGSGIAAGLSVAGFSVRFDWLGPGQPASQPFDIVDPATFQTVYRGTTVPEPCTAISLLACLLPRLPRPAPAGRLHRQTKSGLPRRSQQTKPGSLAVSSLHP